MLPLLIPAQNASEWTGPTGNNTWLLRGREPALIDAGVGRAAHLDAVAAALDGAPLTRVFITHGHSDHIGGLAALRARWPALQVIAGADAHGSIAAGDGLLDVMPTPGHAPDHLCFFDRSTGDLYCGDLAREGGTIVIPAQHGGDLRLYLESLSRVRALAPRRLLPGHGPIVTDPVALIDRYIAHREAREREILNAMRSGAQTPDEIVARVYPDLSPALHAAAVETVLAHLKRTNPSSLIPDP